MHHDINLCPNHTLALIQDIKIMFTRAYQVLMHLSKWDKSLSKSIKEQHLKHSIVSVKEVTKMLSEND